MPSFPDSAVLIILVLLLFGPKKLPVLARQLGKLMNDFRRASNEFRSQMEDELRISEQADRQKQIAAVPAVTPALDPLQAIEAESAYANRDLPPEDSTLESASESTPGSPLDSTDASPLESIYEPLSESALDSTPGTAPLPLPIATSGELSIMPPSTGLPTPNSTPAPLTGDAVAVHHAASETEALHG